MDCAPRDIVITGLGAVCALGEDCGALWSAVAEGRCGITTIGRFSTDAFAVHTGAVVASAACEAPSSLALTEQLCQDFAVRAAREALADAGLGDSQAGSARVALVFGTGLTDRARPLHSLGEAVAEAMGINGACLTVSTACSSSTGALGIARDLLAMDTADVVLAGGADVLTPEVFAGFHALGVLSQTRCAPFSTPSGTTLGEGAGFVVLERAAHARARGANVRAVLSGYGLSADAWHETSPDPKGAGIERAIRAALADADADAATVGYVNAHGSGTEANDSAEWLGISRALGPNAATVPVSSTKGALGHAQGAAGVLEAIVTIAAMERDLIPPTMNFTAPRPHGPSDPVPGPAPRRWSYARAVSVNSAFGGANAAVVLSREGAAPHARARRPVMVRGLGLIGGFGQGIGAFLSVPTGTRHGDGRVPDFSIETLVRAADPRGLDPTARYLTAAAALALRDAGVTVRGPLRDRTGLLVGQRRASPTSLRAFADSIEARGLSQLSATAFARIVLNAAAGACSKLLSLHGPLSVITTGTGSGLAAVALAAELLATRDDVAFMVAGGVDERPADDDTDLTDACPEGAACLLLGAEDSEPDAEPTTNGGSQVRLAGWALAAPGHLLEALASAAPDDASRDARVFRADDPAAGAAGAVFALADAVLALRSRSAGAALVTSDCGRSLATALFLTTNCPPT